MGQIPRGSDGAADYTEQRTLSGEESVPFS
jgi:hypothetical protein